MSVDESWSIFCKDYPEEDGVGVEDEDQEWSIVYQLKYYL
jgi:hypothetical protein